MLDAYRKAVPLRKATADAQAIFIVNDRCDLALALDANGVAIVSDRMRHLEGIVETETMIAFRAYSKQELEAGFELGLD